MKITKIKNLDTIVVPVLLVLLFLIPWVILGVTQNQNEKHLLNSARTFKKCPNCFKEIDEFESDAMVLLHMRDRCKKKL